MHNAEGLLEGQPVEQLLASEHDYNSAAVGLVSPPFVFGGVKGMM